MANYNEEDAAALAALVTRYTRTWNAREADRQLRAEIDARLEAYAVQFKQLGQAFALYGVDGMTKANWDALKQDLGHDLWYQAVSKGSEPPVPYSPRRSQSLLIAASVPDIVEDEEVDKSAEAASGTVREVVLEQLKQAGDKGAKASALRALIETARNKALHEKTVGMTLYRLSQEGLARRDGRTWFYVEPSGETQNPGAEDAGAINRDDKEGEEL